MSEYYDRQGQPISLDQMADLMKDPTYKILGDTELPDGTWISTVWLGLNHQYGSGPPLIFETMVFPRKGPSVSISQYLTDPHSGDHWQELGCWRYATEEQALVGHQRIAETWPDPDPDSRS